MKVTIAGKELKIYWRYSHKRDYWNVKTAEPKKHITTICYITDIHNVLWSTGVAFCSPQDTFKRAIGNKIALTRALKNFEWSWSIGLAKHERTSIWKAYFKVAK